MVSRRPVPERIAKALDPLDEAAEIAALQALKMVDGDQGFTNAEMSVILDRTRSNRLRNAAALALADRHATGLAEHLTALLASPKMAKASGTLLFALDQIDGMLPAPAFLNLIENGSYEARAEALAFLADERVIGSNSDDGEDLVTKLSAVARSDDADAAEAAEEALGHWQARASTFKP